MAAPLRFGLSLPQGDVAPAALRELAQRAERLAFDSLWVYDHLYNYPSAAHPEVMEGWTLLSLMAGWTERVRLGTLVLCDGYRNPALTAKMAATLDVLSGGRLEFGYGAGWHEEETLGYGYAFPPPPARVARMEEGLAIIGPSGRAVR
jgi:alkanesulfonate monooxygenase SsuD/methylene tetrahydromethanopterin reductase-like flavin-dependent oxidoreductase (luciferase family)